MTTSHEGKRDQFHPGLAALSQHVRRYALFPHVERLFDLHLQDNICYMHISGSSNTVANRR